MYARLITALHWTWEYIDDCLTLPRLLAITTHWEAYPPVHESVAAYLGLGTRRTGAPSAAPPSAVVDDADDVGLALMRMFGEAGGIITGV